MWGGTVPEKQRAEVRESMGNAREMEGRRSEEAEEDGDVREEMVLGAVTVTVIMLLTPLFFNFLGFGSERSSRWLLDFGLNYPTKMELNWIEFDLNFVSLSSNGCCLLEKLFVTYHENQL